MLLAERQKTTARCTRVHNHRQKRGEENFPKPRTINPFLSRPELPFPSLPAGAGRGAAGVRDVYGSP